MTFGQMKCLIILLFSLLPAIWGDENFCEAVKNSEKCGKEDSVVILEEIERDWVDRNKLFFIESSGEKTSFVSCVVLLL